MIIDQIPAVRGSLRGKVAVVTGAGRGIGREAARILARLGALAVIAELNETTGRETADLIAAEGGEALFVRTDVADEASVAHLKAQVGHADILVNNAIATSFGPLLEHTVAQWDKVMAVNLRGTFLCLKAFVPGMLERKYGVAITVESSEGMPYLAPYLASKVAHRSLALSLAQEVGEASGVSVFCFGPGMVDTPGLAEALEKLPALYGMTRDEFIRQSGVSLLDAEAVAAGLVSAILHAREFHGQQVGFASGLARLGLNVAGEVAGPAVEPAEVGAPAPAAVVRGDLRAVLDLNRQFEGILRDNIREYDELTLFQRPLVKRMFQAGTGLKVEEWHARAQAMTAHLERMLRERAPWGQANPTEYVALLGRMAQYIKKQEIDARGYFRDPAALDRALKALAERHSVVTRLAEALEAACD